jgi:hypothetical protein
VSGKKFVFAAFSGMWVIFHIFTSLLVNLEDNRLRFLEGIDFQHFFLVGILPVVVGWCGFLAWQRLRPSAS